jgi:superfamily II DNA or RNA helicase
MKNYIAAYARAGHYCIAVSERIKMLDSITEMLKAEGFKVAAFHNSAIKNKVHREQILQDARKGDIQILIANRSMVLGLDIPRLTTFFNLTPSANPPNYYQEFSRVRTPFENKLLSYVVDFVDFHTISLGCLQSRRKVYIEHGFEIEE